MISGRVWQESSQVSGGLVVYSHGVCESPKKGAWGTGGEEREEGYLLRDAEFLILGGWSSQRDLKSGNNIVEECLDSSLFSLRHWLIHPLIHTKDFCK